MYGSNYRGIAENGKFIYGFLVKKYGKTVLIHEIKVNRNKTVFCETEVKSETVGAFSGLKDINGVSIYDGDIYLTIKGNKYFVKWVAEKASFRLFPFDSQGIINFHLSATVVRNDKARVIGNIHLNKELF